MQSQAANIAEYLAELDETDRAVIATLDRLIRTHAPDAVGSMQYGMPTYAIGRRTIALNAQKLHYSVYADPEVLARHRVALAGLNVGKSCIRFKTIERAPLKVLEAILRDYGR